MPRKIIIGLLFSTFICNSLRSQNRAPEVYLNHIFIVLDSVSYRKLSDSNLVTQKLGDLKFSSTTTAEDSWSGKYFFGKNGYFEFFSTNSYKGAQLGDCGFGFMTQKANDILVVEKYWKSQSRDSIFKDTSMRMLKGIKHPWFYSLGLYTTDSIPPVNTWLMEHTPQHLKSVGFSAEDIAKTISWEDYITKKNKTAFRKSFNRIKAIHLLLDRKSYAYLKASLLGFSLKEKGNMFYNSQIAITYTLNETYPIRLQTAETELTETFEENYIKLSDKLKVHVKGKRATWLFNY